MICYSCEEIEPEKICVTCHVTLCNDCYDNSSGECPFCGEQLLEEIEEE